MHLRTVEHRLQILHEFQTHTLPEEPEALGLPGPAHGRAGARRARRARRFQAAHRRMTARRARARSAEFFAAPARRSSARRRRASRAPRRSRRPDSPIPSGRARTCGSSSRGARSCPYPGAPRRALRAVFPAAARRALEEPRPRRGAQPVRAVSSPPRGRAPVLSSCWPTRSDLLRGLVRLCARGDLLTQLLITQPELLTSLADPATFAGAAKSDARAPRRRSPPSSPRLTRTEQRDRLRRVKQAAGARRSSGAMLLGRQHAERFSREMTALAEAALAVAWLLALDEAGGRSRRAARRAGPVHPRRDRGSRKVWRPRARPPARTSISSWSSAETGGPTASRPSRPHVFYDRAVERLAERARRHHRGRVSRSRWISGCVRAPRAAVSRPASTRSSGTTPSGRIRGSARRLTRARLVGGDPRPGPRACDRALGGSSTARGARRQTSRRCAQLRERDGEASWARRPRARCTSSSAAAAWSTWSSSPRRSSSFMAGGIPRSARANTAAALRRHRARRAPARGRAADLVETLPLPAARLGRACACSARAPPTRSSWPGPCRRAWRRPRVIQSRKEFLDDYRRRTAGCARSTTT